MKSRQIHPRFWHQGRQSGDEVQWLKDNVRRAIAVRCLELVTDLAIGGQRKAFFRHRWTVMYLQSRSSFWRSFALAIRDYGDSLLNILNYRLIARASVFCRMRYAYPAYMI